ncbi:MAG: ABC transporter substrate-binding protein [Nanoarchaeota archaeon]|mgnify:FL=1
MPVFSSKLGLVQGMFILLIFFSFYGCTSKQDLIIGAVIPLTGWGAYYGTSELHGMEMARDEINSAGGIHGNLLQIAAEDSKGDGKEAVTATQKLLNFNTPLAFVVSFAPPALAIAPILKEAQTPFIYDAYIKSPIQDNPYAFKSHFDPEMGCKLLVQYAQQKKLHKKLGAIFAQIEYNQICLDAAKQLEPDLNVYWYNFGDTDFRTLFLKAKADGVDTLLILGWENEFIPFFTQKAEQGYNFNILCGTASECISSNTLKQLSTSQLNGVIGTDFAAISEKPFVKQYKEKYPGASEANVLAAAFGYESIQILATALNACSQATKECLLNQLSLVKNYPSVLGTHGFNHQILDVDTNLYRFEGNGWKLIS